MLSTSTFPSRTILCLVLACGTMIHKSQGFVPPPPQQPFWTTTTTTRSIRALQAPMQVGPRRCQSHLDAARSPSPHDANNTRRRSRRPQPSSSSSSSLSAAKSSASSSTKSTSSSSSFADENRRLLADVVAYRRLQAIEAQLQESTGRSVVFPSQLCVAAGYGADDFEILDTIVDRGYRARERLVTHNMGLVHYAVNAILALRKRQHKPLHSLSRDDLVQEGAIGLARAVDKWNPELGGKFSVYALYWIRAAILRGIAERDDLVRVPEHVSTAVRKMTAAAARLGIVVDGDDWLQQVYGSNSSSAPSSSSSSSSLLWKEAEAARVLAEEAGLSEKQLTLALQVQARRMAGGVLSFEEGWMQRGRNLETDVPLLFQDNEDYNNGVDPFQRESHQLLTRELARFLRPKEVEALSWRYGLLNDEDNNNNNNNNNEPETTPSSSTRSSSSTRTSRTTTTTRPARRKRKASGGVSVVPPRPTVRRGKWGEAMSFDEVGQRMRISAEYGRKLCHRALDKLREAYKDGQLEPSFFNA